MTLIIVGLVSILLSWAVFYLIALVADSISYIWTMVFFISVILYTVVVPFWLFETFNSALSISFVGFLILALGERILRDHVSMRQANYDRLLDRLEEVESKVIDLSKRH